MNRSVFEDINVDDLRDLMSYDEEINTNNAETFNCGTPEEFSDFEDFARKMASIELTDTWNDGNWVKPPEAEELPSNPFSSQDISSASSVKLDDTSLSHIILSSESPWSYVPARCASVTKQNEVNDYQTYDCLLPAPRVSIPPMPVAPMLEVLEQQMMKQHECPIPITPVSMVPSVAICTPLPTPMYCPPPFTVPADYQPFVQYWHDYLIGRIHFLPHEVPAVPQFIMDGFRQNNPLVLAWLRQEHKLEQPPDVEKENEVTYDDHGNIDTSRRGIAVTTSVVYFYHPNKVPGMPSGRTIQDLAFDQFAGFMSYKERQWLIRIQMLQCQGTGDTSVDDYYYINWKKKQLEINGMNLINNSDIKEGYNSKEDYSSILRNRKGEWKKNITHSKNLGRPYKCTSNFPRHLITMENND